MTTTPARQPTSRPVLFIIDDDAGVVRALRSDLSRRFSRDFRVLGESSATAALAKLRQLARRGEPVALLIVDHHMTQMPGVEFLARAHELHRSAKRVLLVERDYSVRSPVVQAMTLGQADLRSAAARAVTSASAMSPSSGPGRPAWRPPSTPPPRDSRRSCWRRQSPAGRQAAAR